MDGQKNRYKENERIDSWVLFFMDCLITLIQRLEAKYETYSKLKTGDGRGTRYHYSDII